MIRDDSPISSKDLLPSSEVSWSYAQAIIDFTTAVIHANSVDEVLWLLTDEFIETLGFEDCVVYLLDEARQKLVQKAAYGHKKSGPTRILNPIELGYGEGITGQCAETQRSILVSDVSTDPYYVVDDQARMSELAVPIISGEKTIGVIDSEHSQRDFFQAHHIATLRALSSIITTKYDRQCALSDLQESESKLRRLANFDSLSNLPNRHHFITSLRAATQQYERGELTGIGVLIIDMDRFKLINDTYGHAAGDELIVKVSKLFRQALPESLLLARLGGDEFAVLVTDRSPMEAEAVGEALLAAVGDPISLTVADVRTSASIGLAEYHVATADEGATPSNATAIVQRECDPTSLMRLADGAMYRAKASGRDRCVVSGMLGSGPVLSDLNMAAAINTALSTNQFELYLQPIVELTTQDITGFESLIRWPHPEAGMVLPDQFIDFAERSGQIGAIDLYMLQQSRQCLDDLRRDLQDDISINLNVSASLLSRSDWFDGPTGELFVEGVNIEVTERAVIADTARAASMLSDLQSRGSRIFIDDFGTGYSSLSYLQMLPCDVIKIDKSFISGLGESEMSLSLVRLLVSLAETMGTDLLAEGIETREQLEILQRLGVGYGQGYLFARPMPVTEARAHLEARLSRNQN